MHKNVIGEQHESDGGKVSCKGANLLPAIEAKMYQFKELF